MKRNLLSSAIIVAIMALGLTGCDDKKPKQKRPCPPIVNLPHQLLKRNLLKLPLQKQMLNLKHLRNRWSMNKRFSTKNGCLYQVLQQVTDPGTAQSGALC